MEKTETVRAPREDELEAAAAVLAADDLHEIGEVMLDADFLRDFWSTPQFDRTRDSWVLVDPTGEIIGYADVLFEPPDLVESMEIVAPAHRTPERRAMLLDRIEARAAELLADVAGGRLLTSSNQGDKMAPGLLGPRGFELVRHFWHMQIDDVRKAVRGTDPAGIRMRAVDVTTDLPVIHSLLMETFDEHWGHQAQSFEVWRAEKVGRPNHDPTLWTLAVDEDDEPVAVLTATVLDGRGWISQLGVRSSHRGRGIGSALLHRAFAAFGEREIMRVVLNVDAGNATGATVLYERVGMRILRQWDMWERS